MIDYQEEILLNTHRVRYGKLVPSTGTTSRKDLFPGFRTHTATKSMLVYSLPTAWLKCPFHR